MSDSNPRIFLSHSSADKPWVETLYRNLVAIFGQDDKQGGRPFFDKVDIVPAMSWVQRLDKGLAESDRFVLVVTPEAMASPWVNKELLATLARRPNGSDSNLLIVLLRWAPLPALLEDCQHVDFRDHDEDRYLEALAELLAGLEGAEDLAAPRELPKGLEIPSYPADPLGEDLRRDVVDWLAALLEHGWFQDVAQVRLGLDPALVKALPPRRLASHLVVELTRAAAPPHEALHERLVSIHPTVADVRQDASDDLQALLDRLLIVTPPPAAFTALDAYLELVRQDTKEVSTFLIRRMGAPRLLKNLYVQRTVGDHDPDASRHAAAGGPPTDADVDKLRGRLHQTLEDLLAASLHDSSTTEPATPHRWILLGEPGAGKTTLLRHLAFSCTERDDLPWIPVLVDVADAVAAEEWFPQWVASTYRNRHAPEDLGELLDDWARREDTRVLVLLDGLDEVAVERREATRTWLQTLVHEWPHARFVVTSRPIPYESLGEGFEELQVQPLSRQDRVELVALHLTDEAEPTAAQMETAERHVAELERNPWLVQWMGNPLYVTLIALLLRQGETPSTRQHELYRQVIDLLLKGEHRPDARPMKPLKTVRRILADFAHHMTETNRSEVSSDDLEDRLLGLKDLVERLQTYGTRYRKDLDTFFEDLTRTGLFAPYARPDWRFLHRTFREALTAEHLAEQAKTSEGLAAVLARARGLAGDDTPEEDLSRWAEPFALLVGQVDERDELVTALVEANRSLGLRSLGGAHGLRVETVRTVLAATGGWEQRAEVFRAVPQVVGAADEALELLDTWRQETRNGNDLFWLEWAVRQMGRRHRELAGQVADLLGRFFDHIPAPPEKLFTTVETSEDGVVPLWRKIRAGEFLMGSPEDEEGRFDWEGPRHRVVIQSDFHVAAVPITRDQYSCFDPEHAPPGFRGVYNKELPPHPVIEVTWYAAVAFCRWLSQALAETSGARLPTEAEWEYACRAGQQTAYWSGNTNQALRRVGWIKDNSGRHTHRVGEKPANPWGLYDVHGNVWEWTVSPWTDYPELEDRIVADPLGISVAEEIGDYPDIGMRVARGGSYGNAAQSVRSASRGTGDAWNRSRFLGFRVLLPAAPSDRS